MRADIRAILLFSNVNLSFKQEVLMHAYDEGDRWQTLCGRNIDIGNYRRMHDEVITCITCAVRAVELEAR